MGVFANRDFAEHEQLSLGKGNGYLLWRTLVRYVAPVGVLIVFIYNLTCGLDGPGESHEIF